MDQDLTISVIIAVAVIGIFVVMYAVSVTYLDIKLFGIPTFAKRAIEFHLA